MTQHALRVTIGDDAYWRLVRSWLAKNRLATGSTDEFIALAERVSGQQLDALFDAWLFQPGQPPHPGDGTVLTRGAAKAATAPAYAERVLSGTSTGRH